MGGMVSKDVIDRIRNGIDIADYIGGCIPLKKAGSAWVACCPFHKEKTPSFHVNPARQAFHCFGCGAGGDIFKFVMMYDGVDFPGALKLLAPRAGVALEYEEEARPRDPGAPTKEDLFAANADAAERYRRRLEESPDAAAAREYLLGRSLGPALWREWTIGYAPDEWHFISERVGEHSPRRKLLEAAGLLSVNEKGNFYDRFRDRVMFTIRDELGRVVGFSGRIMKTEDARSGGKYVNTSETEIFRKSRILFALDKARHAMQDQRRALLVEGQIDCIRCHAAGFRNAVASQGTAFTDQHARLLRRYADHVLIVLDADTAGRKAALRTAALLMEEGLAVSLASLPPGEDPDSLILKQGPEAFAAVLEKACSPMAFLLDGMRGKADFATQEGLLQALRPAVELATHAQSSAQAELMMREAAAVLGVGVPSLMKDLQAAKRKKYRFQSAANLPGGGEPETPKPDETASATVAQPAAAPAEPPPEEYELAVLLCNHNSPELAGFVRQWLRYPMLSHPDARRIIAALAEEEDLLASLDGEAEPCQSLAAKIANTPVRIAGGEDISTPERAVRDLVLRIWLGHLQRRQRDIRLGLARTPAAGKAALLAEFNALSKDVAGLRRGWDAAEPVLVRLLDRMDEI
jgi:DNA primase